VGIIRSVVGAPIRIWIQFKRKSKSSFLPATGEGGGGALLVDLVLLAVVGLVAAQDHGGLACVLGVVVPDGLVSHGVGLLGGVLDGLFVPPGVVLALAQDDATLVVVRIEAYISRGVPLELLGRLKMSLLPPFQPSDHWLSIPMGLWAFLVGLSTGGLEGVTLPAGLSSIFKLFYLYVDISAVSYILLLPTHHTFTPLALQKPHLTTPPGSRVILQ